jgi:hypothetical protein
VCKYIFLNISSKLYYSRQEIDVSNLISYLTLKIPEIKLPIEILQFKLGQSNPTYLLIDARYDFMIYIHLFIISESSYFHQRIIYQL